MFYWPRRILYDCTGGKIIDKPPNHLIRHHNTNAQSLKSSQKTIGKALFDSRINGDKVMEATCNFYCTEEGEIKMPSSKLTEMPNIMVHAVRLATERDERITYCIFANPKFYLLTDIAIRELVTTERNLNITNKAIHWQDFVLDKLRKIKEAQGIQEARRWAVYYESVIEVKGVSGWWSLYWLQ